jgi:succinate dehydrogenase hydrophobic anchor subunit
MTLTDFISIFMLLFVLFLAMAAIIHGYKGLKKSKDFRNNRKVQARFGIASFLHLLAGVLLVLFCLIIGALSVFTYIKMT